MVNPNEWQKEVFEIYDKIKSHKEPYDIKIGDLTITVLPNVFSPKYFTDSFWFAKEISKIVKNKTLLEIGSGTGIIAVLCAINGAKVVATDINPDAVSNTKLNARKYNLDIDVREGSIYEPIKKEEKFDFIFWNHPFNKWETEIKDVLLKAGFDTKYTSLRRYVEEAKKYLSLDGKLLLGTGNFADLSEIKEIAKVNNYELILLKEKEFPVTEGGKVKNKYLIYEFKEI